MAPFALRSKILAALGMSVFIVGSAVIVAWAIRRNEARSVRVSSERRAPSPRDSGEPRSYDQLHGPAPGGHLRPPALVASQFTRAWLACVYHQASCSALPDTVPAYAQLVEPELASTPTTQADRGVQPRVTAVRVVYNCPFQAVGIVTYTLGGGPVLELHPNLVREVTGWQVYEVPEFPAHIPLPRPLTGGVHLC